jgi:hypothetical protein
VAREISLGVIHSELEAVASYASASGLELERSTLTERNLLFVVRFANQEGLLFHAEFDCTDYPLYPPNIEFTNEQQTERGTKRLYPQGFHTTPCVCMRYNRKAYSERGGPHGDWRLLDWRLPSGSGVGIDCLALMVSDLHSKIRESRGRML